MALQFGRDGAELFPGFAADWANHLLPLFPETGPGRRIGNLGELRTWLAGDGPIARLVSRQLGKSARPVRAIAFDKNPTSNWGLGWHQDRVIAVRSRRDMVGYGPWTIKHGQQHVQPPADLVGRMATVRIHADDVGATNAPLRIAPGSHLFGRIEECRIDRVVRDCGEAPCLAKAGDVWLYSTPILHASDRSTSGKRRRVLQVDYAAEELPDGLEWALA